MHITKTKKSILNALPAPVIIVNSRFRARFMNKSSHDLLGQDPDTHEIKEQYHRLLEEKGKKETRKTKNAAFNTGVLKKAFPLPLPGNGKTMVQALYVPFDDNAIMIMLRNIDKEMRLIDEFLYLRREVDAKNFLLESKRKYLDEFKNKLSLLMDNLPEGMAMIDKYFNLRECNTALINILPNPNAGKCYELFGYSSVCENCPAVNSEATQEYSLVGHNLGPKYFTETFVELPSPKGALLLFKDSTRQVVLIEQIRRQKETIQQQKDVFSGLVDLMQSMQKMEDTEEISEQFLKILSGRMGTQFAVLLLENQKRRDIWFKSARGVEKSVLEKIAKSYLELDRRSRDQVVLPENALPRANKEIVQTPILGYEKKQLGLLVLVADMDDEKRQILQLYTEPFGAYLDNRLLYLRLEELANTDGLTGVFNRAYMESVFSEEEKKHEKYNIPFSIIMADVNGLKRANDLYGHDAGDALIKETAGALLQICRDTDIVARIGGDEFCIIMPGKTQGNALPLMERIKRHCAEKKVRLSGGNYMPVSISLGASGSDRVPTDQMLKEADRAMYLDKQKYYRGHGKE